MKISTTNNVNILKNEDKEVQTESTTEQQQRLKEETGEEEEEDDDRTSDPNFEFEEYSVQLKS